MYMEERKRDMQIRVGGRGHRYQRSADERSENN
jgi:hypothetical protein